MLAYKAVVRLGVAVGGGEVRLDVVNRRAVHQVGARHAHHRHAVHRLYRFDTYRRESQSVGTEGRAGGEDPHPGIAAQAWRAHRRRPPLPLGSGKTPYQPQVRKVGQPAHRLRHGELRLEDDVGPQLRNEAALPRNPELGRELAANMGDRGNRFLHNALLLCHNVKDEVVGGGHPLQPDVGHVADALLDVLVDDALDGADGFVLHCQHGRKDGGGDTRRHLEGTTGLRTVADHTGDVGDHVLDGKDDLVVVTAEEIGEAAGGASGSRHAAAQRRKPPEALLDVYDGEVAQREGTDQILLALEALLRIYPDRQRGGDALVAAAGIAHHGHFQTRHTGVAGGGGVSQYLGIDAVAEELLVRLEEDHFPELVAVIAAQGDFGGFLVEFGGFKDEVQLADGRGRGEVVNQRHGERNVTGDGVAGRGAAIVGEDFAVLGDVAEMGVFTADDDGGAVVAVVARHLDVKLLLGIFFLDDADALLADVLFGGFHGFGIHVLQHFQPVFRLSGNGTECNGDGKPHHASAGYADPHGVLEHVGAQSHFNLLGHPAQNFFRFCHG